MEAKKSSPITRMLTALAKAVFRYRNGFVYPQILLFGVCVFYTVSELGFNTSRNDLVGDEKKYHKIYLEFLEEFDAPEDVVVVVESESPEKNRQFVERLGRRLRNEPDVFQNVLFRSDIGSLGPKALFFLDRETLVSLEESLRKFEPFIHRFSSASNLYELFGEINAFFRESANERTGSDFIEALPALTRILTRAADSVQRVGLPPSPGVSALFGGGETAETSEYVTYGDGRYFLVSAQPAENVKYSVAIARLRDLVEITRNEAPGVNAGVTGGPVLEKDEMDQAQSDMLRASGLSFLLVALVFVFGYHSTGRPIKAAAALMIGLGYTMGYTTLVVGHLNILTITFAPILIGLAIDLGIHLVSRFEEELRNGETLDAAMTASIVHTGKGILTGALTTAGAFFAMAFTPFDGIQEMGIITGGGMLVTLVPMMTFLPALLIRGRQNVVDHTKIPHRPSRLAGIEKLWLKKPMVALAVVGGLSIAAASQTPKLWFDYNLLNLQTDGIPSVVFEKKLINAASKSVVFCASIAEDAEEAKKKKEAFENLDSIDSVITMAEYIEGDWESKTPLIERISKLAASFERPEIDREPIDLEAWRIERLNPLKGYLFYAQKRLEEENRPDLSEPVSELQDAVIEALNTFPVSPADPSYASAVDKLSSYQQELFSELNRIFAALASQETEGGLTIADLPPELRNRFIGNSGKYMLQIYPKENVWEHEHQKVFIRDLRSVDPNVTGTPVQQYEYTALLVNSYLQAGAYALCAIALMALIHFRSFIAAALTLTPVIFGSLWALGILAILDVPFNPANIMTLPLVIGIGVTNGVHILNRYAEEGTPELLGISTGKAVIVSALTTIAGFSSLLVAQHNGISSLGLVMSLGVGACLIAGLTVVPACLVSLNRKGWKLRRYSP